MRPAMILCLLLIPTVEQACSSVTKSENDLGEAAAVVRMAMLGVPASVKLSFVDPNDPNRMVLSSEEDHVRQRRSTGSVVIDELWWREIRGDSLARLFPTDRFYVYGYSWHERKSGIGNSPVVRVFVVDHAGQGRRFEPYGPYEEFGAFLRERGVRIRTKADAERVWSAFCQSHLKFRRGNGVRRVGDRRWDLLTTNGYVYEVTLAGDGTIASARFAR